MRTSCKVKICGLTRREDVELAVGLGADYLGFVLVPASKRFVPEHRWRSLTENLPEHVKCVAVMADPDGRELAAARRCFDIIQFHGSESPDVACGGASWKALHLAAPEELGKLGRFRVEHFVLDAACGGSGVRCDWSLAAHAAEKYEILLAGGLSPENVASALEFVKPWGVDVSGGVEASPGIKSEAKMREFFKELKK